jgi:tripartite-type tricarboxylate transporter receptor subunit TctC
VPTFAEAGFPDIDGSTFTGLMAPAKTPQAVITRVNSEMAKILADASVKAKFRALGAETVPMSPQEFTKYLEKEDSTWIPIIRKTNVKSQ